MMDFHRRGRRVGISLYLYFPSVSSMRVVKCVEEKIFFNYEKRLRSLSPPEKIYRALRMSVKLHLMLNSKMLIDGDGEGYPIIMATSLLEASNLLVLKDGSVIQSNANLGIHRQGSLNLTGEGNIIEAHKWICVSIFLPLLELVNRDHERTSSSVVLINILKPLDPDRWPYPPKNESFATRNMKFSDLVVKCLIKLTKVIQSTIYEVDLDRILQRIHMYLQD
ncbi:hypothetical protein L1987_30034 [Smallanthus sonchifolius]|uniref:Uncharacterized protein n=1 Tax=Smallanthus sonchifolius TaxID=185202 RepID=A0ACB9I2B7_9ASTR|nr:hypothetical protein L1987_30034 [Smallanthus sonchifolius]